MPSTAPAAATGLPEPDAAAELDSTALATIVAASASPDDPATSADYAAVEFEPLNINLDQLRLTFESNWMPIAIAMTLLGKTPEECRDVAKDLSDDDQKDGFLGALESMREAAIWYRKVAEALDAGETRLLAGMCRLHHEKKDALPIGQRPVPAVADETNPDAALIRLRAEYDRTRTIWEASSPAHSRAEDAYMATRQAEPACSEEDARTASGLSEAESVYYRLLAENAAFVAAMAGTPASTLAGLIAKAEVCDIESNSVPDLSDSIVADLLAMKARTA